VVRIEDIFSVLCVTKKKGHTNTLTARPFEVEEKKKELKLMQESLLGKILFRVI